MTGDPRALVLGGGGVAGIAWETGIIVGLADEGVLIASADVVVGTSAGSTVAAQVTGPESLDELFARQLVPPDRAGELMATLDIDGLTAMFTAALRAARSPVELRAAIGRASMAAETVPESTRRKVIEHRLSSHVWPDGRDVRIVAVDAESGVTRVFTAADGVSIVDAVGASCAVPGVWPPVSIEGRRYIDGGVRSSTNADLASGCGVIIVLAPSQNIVGIADSEAMAAIDHLEQTATMLTVTPDDHSIAAIGTNSLDPATRAPAATAGRAQGRRMADQVRAIWNQAAR